MLSVVAVICYEGVVSFYRLDLAKGVVTVKSEKPQEKFLSMDDCSLLSTTVECCTQDAPRLFLFTDIFIAVLQKLFHRLLSNLVDGFAQINSFHFLNYSVM
ncbi:unnamed protein product [Wuchereria bancrofti]|uniref:Uncharacterized protein n=1 Tax=Wuchereria bancrofti TaxID=6293 RepID=A0A3P7FX78_WUCBA|nr:unnamed protein product [Wuchereria bancrofti]